MLRNFVARHRYSGYHFVVIDVVVDRFLNMSSCFTRFIIIFLAFVYLIFTSFYYYLMKTREKVTRIFFHTSLAQAFITTHDVVWYCWLERNTMTIKFESSMSSLLNFVGFCFYLTVVLDYNFFLIHIVYVSSFDHRFLLSLPVFK